LTSSGARAGERESRVSHSMDDRRGGRNTLAIILLLLLLLLGVGRVSHCHLSVIAMPSGH
jgi:hypothetical protein